MNILRLLLSLTFQSGLGRHKIKYDMQLTNIELCIRFSGISLKTLKQLVAAFNGMNINSSLADFLCCFAGCM